MCGIAGLFKFDGSVTKDDVAAVERMNDILFLRGPDGGGVFADDKTVLANRRLAIIDLSDAGKQPLSNDAQTVTVTFNGEIYNFAELRSLLVEAGYRFKSNTDTEVLIHGYEEWSIEGLLQRLRGMFAFALYDRREPVAKLYLCRDRFGIKPVYYAHRPCKWISFASEIKALSGSGLVSSSENPDALIGYLLFGSVPRPITTFKDISILPPGTYLTASDGAIELKSYYKVEDLFSRTISGKNGSIQRQIAETKVRNVLDAAIKLHLVSDAPLGVFLSGGIDSSTLVALCSGQQGGLSTIGITFSEPGYSEEFYQRLVAQEFAVRHHSVPVTSAEFSDEMDRFFSVMDQPTLDGINTYFVTRAAQHMGFKAVLSGVGGDEVFSGYPTLKRAWTLNLIHSLPAPLRNAIAGTVSFGPQYRKLAFLNYKGSIPFYLVQRGLFTPKEVAELLDVEVGQVISLIQTLEPTNTPGDPTTLQQFLEMHHYLTDQLLRDTDVFGMANSVEVRVPFLDHILIEEVLSLPTSLRHPNGVPKPLLTGAMGKLLPSQIVYRPKKGFTFPMQFWLKTSSSWIDDPGPGLNSRAFYKVLEEFKSGKAHWSRFWALLVLGRSRRIPSNVRRAHA
jgi:asparagine synthase (glutamine-hydrolysing)